MIKVTKALAAKKRGLLEQKQTVEEDAKRRSAEIDAQIADLDKAMETLDDAVKDCLCPRCGGTGKERVCDAAGQMETVACRACHGTGLKTGDETPNQWRLEGSILEEGNDGDKTGPF